jgi:hypothetical protein
MTTLRRPQPFVLVLLAAAVPGLTLHAQTPPRDSGVLRVDVVAQGDEPSVEAPYVAIVPETSPWSEPLREAVIEEGSSVTWALPPGRYRVAAGAPGTTVEHGETIDLAAGTRHHERLELTRLPAVEGRVVDETGEPLPGATVAHLRRLVHDFPRRLSPLGEEHLRETFESTAGEDGRFEVRLHPEAGAFLAARANGRTPRFFSNLRLSHASSVLGNLVLSPGGSLEVTWAVSEPGEWSYDRLQLMPVDRKLPPGIDPPLALAVWSRPFPKSGRAAWSSLPPGRYEIWIKASPRGAHEDVPVRVGEVSIVAGERSEVPLDRVALTEALVDPEMNGTDAGTVDLLLPALSTTELETLEIRGWRDTGSLIPRVLPFTARRTSGGTLVRVEGACRPDASLALVTDSRVGTIELDRIACDAGGGVPRLQLVPRADVDLEVRAPEGETLPPVARLSIGPCLPPEANSGAPRSDLPVRLEMAVPLEGDGTRGLLHAPTAAGCTAVTARIGAYAALDWPDLEVEASTTLDLGVHRLRTGAALLVRVFSGTDGRPLDGVTVRALDPGRALAVLQDGSTGADDAGASVADGRTGGAAVTSRGGWARLHGLPPRRDLVVLLQGEGRRMPHPAADIRLAPGEERMLDSLELPPPASVEIRVELSRRLEEVEAVPYQVFLRQTGADGPPLSLSRDVGPERIVVLEDLPAGTWRLEGIARGPDGKPFPAGSTEIELGSGERKLVEFELADSLYEGRVTYEGISVEGSLSISPVSPLDRRGMSVRLDENGHFRLPLEGPGTYTVQVFDHRDRRFDQATLAAVEFGDPDEKIRIRVPEGRIGGVVIDEEGVPVPGAVVHLASRQSATEERFRTVQVTSHTTPKGRFLTEGLGAGIWTVTGGTEGRRSEPEVVTIAPDERVESLELVVEPTNRVRGLLMDAGGLPVAGARLAVGRQPSSPGEIPDFRRATTDSDGRFEISTGSVGHWANLRVITSDGAAHALRTRLDLDLSIQLPPASGGLEIDLPCVRSRAWLSGNFFLVSQVGAFLPITSLAMSDPSGSQKECRVIRTASGLGIGSWRIVRVNTPEDEILLFFGQGGTLESHGELTAHPGSPSRVHVDKEEPDASDIEN